MKEVVLVALLVTAAAFMIKAAPGAAALVVANVLDNAVKFSPLGGEVWARASIEDGAAVVSVSDSGPGVTEEEIPRLFKRFYRGSAARRTEVPGASSSRRISGQGKRSAVPCWGTPKSLMKIPVTSTRHCKGPAELTSARKRQ